MTDDQIKEICLQEAGIDLGRYSYDEIVQIKDALRRYYNAKIKLTMKTFTNKKGISYVFFDVPEDARDFKIFNDEQPYLSYFKGVETPRQYLPQGNYELIGLAKDVSESQAAEIVDGFIKYDGQSKPISGIHMFQGYSDGRDRFTGKQSLSSLIQSLGLNNPIILKLIK